MSKLKSVTANESRTMLVTTSAKRKRQSLGSPLPRNRKCSLRLVLVLTVFCLAQRVSMATAAVTSGRIFNPGYEEMLYNTVFPANQTACPASCVCQNEGLMVLCIGQNLTQVPKDIPAKTTHLDLSVNNISFLPENAFANLTVLQELRLASNMLQTLPKKIFRKNKFLSTLYLQGNMFKTVPRGALQNLKFLLELHLDANQIREVPANCFKNLIRLKKLWLDFNNLARVPTRALSSLPKLQALNLALNNITTIHKFAFRNLSSLVILILYDSNVKRVDDYGFAGLKSLRNLRLDKNELTEIPTSLSHLESLVELNLAENFIRTLPDNSFRRNRDLKQIKLLKNPIQSIGTRAFSHLPKLEKIVLSEVTNMFTFPDLNGTNNLNIIRLDRAAIRVVPPAICQNRWLKTLDIHSNKITMIPELSHCDKLWNLNLGNNQLLSLEGKPFRGLSQLLDLTLAHNMFTYIPEDAFYGLNKLEYLDIAHNQIKTIHPSAFMPLTNLLDLNLADNKIQALPTEGLQSLQKLKTFDNDNLRDFPPLESFPKVYSLVLGYAYHCCDFLKSASIPTDTIEMLDEEVKWLSKDGEWDLWPQNVYNHTQFWSTHFGDNETNLLEDDIYIPDEHDQTKEPETYLEDIPTNVGENVKNLVVAKPPISCIPKPGPFMPCDDLFGWWSLRCGVWFVFLLALLGNAVVLFVSVTSRSRIDVPRFLICNLACADFFMGVYLCMLAMVDAFTLGEFRKHAIEWQLSGGCLVAGFLGVLSSELSVFTLTIITLERFYAITHAMQLNKRLSLRQAGYIMAGGWLGASTLASLPLFGISDFRKFAICLPFEVEDVISKTYVCCILVLNGVAFCIILFCYLWMYLSIRNSQAWNSNDTRVAKRMALLVFTDFLCWAPIAFFSLGASFGKNFIDLSGAKVLTIFVLPLNSCANPFLYVLFTKQFKRDCVLLCRRLEDSARLFSRASNRQVSFSWGSSRRQSQLHPLVNREKGGSCSHSVPAGSTLGVVVGGGGGVAYHCDPDSGKGSLEYEKVPTSEETPSSHEGCDCCGCCENVGGADTAMEGNRRAIEEDNNDGYDSTNAYNDMLTRCCNVQNGCDGGGTCSWQCRDCQVIMHHHQQQQQHEGRNSAYNNNSTSGGNGGGGGGGGGGGRMSGLSSDDYNLTSETFLPSSDVDQDDSDLAEALHVSAHHNHHHGDNICHHSHHNNRGNGGAAAVGGGQNSQQQQHNNNKHNHHHKSSGCSCTTSRSSRSRKEKSPRAECRHCGEKANQKKKRKSDQRSRNKETPAVAFTNGGSKKDRVDIRTGSDLTRCCGDGGGGGGAGRGGGGNGCLGGALRCCSSANSSPVENERNQHHHHSNHHHRRRPNHHDDDYQQHRYHHHHHHQHNHDNRQPGTRQALPFDAVNSDNNTPPTTKITITQHPADDAYTTDVIRDDVVGKPDDADSGHDLGDESSAYRGEGSSSGSNNSVSDGGSGDERASAAAAGEREGEEEEPEERLESGDVQGRRRGGEKEKTRRTDSLRVHGHKGAGGRGRAEGDREESGGGGNNRSTNSSKTKNKISSSSTTSLTTAPTTAKACSSTSSANNSNSNKTTIGTTPCRRSVDKSEHIRLFTDSLMSTQPHVPACRSNSLVELTQTSQAKISAPLYQHQLRQYHHPHPHNDNNNSNNRLQLSSSPTSSPYPTSASSATAKRLSLTPRQEGYLLLNSAATAMDDSFRPPYLVPQGHEEDVGEFFPTYEELQRYRNASTSSSSNGVGCSAADGGKKHCHISKDRAQALDRSAAPREEVCGLLEEGGAGGDNSEDMTLSHQVQVRDGGESQ